MRYTYEQLRKLTRDEVVAHYDTRAGYAEPGLDFFRDELARRDHEEQTAEMLALTRSVRKLTLVIAWLTAVVTVLTTVNLAVVIKALGQ